MTPRTLEAFSQALLSPEPLLAGVAVQADGTLQQRLAIYRNNLRAARTEALRQGFPVLDRLLGHDCFTALAAEFIRQHPPVSAVLHEYGAGLADFIRGFAPLAALGYLADVARLEWARLQAFHAADAPVLRIAEMDLTTLAERLGQPLQWHPSVTLLRSEHPLYQLWLSQVDTTPAPHAGCWHAEQVLVWRQGLQLRTQALDEASVLLLVAAREPVRLSVLLAEQPDWLGRLLQLFHWEVFVAG